jgi:hypothetical protein
LPSRSWVPRPPGGRNAHERHLIEGRQTKWKLPAVDPSKENGVVFCRLLSLAQLFHGGPLDLVSTHLPPIAQVLLLVVNLAHVEPGPHARVEGCQGSATCFALIGEKCVLLTPTLHEGRKHCGNVRGGTFSGASAMGGLENIEFALPTPYRVWIRAIHRQFFGPVAARCGRIHYGEVCN